MFNMTIGRPATLAGEDAVQADTGTSGHIVYGQYVPVRPGRFRVEFPLALVVPADARRGVCAVIDVTAHYGEAGIARRDVTAAEVAAGGVTLEFSLHEFRTLEFRVASYGTTALVAGPPRLVRLGEPEGEPRSVDPQDDTRDPVALNQMARATMRLLRPMRARGVSKVRLGHAGDGGYICLDDFRGVDTALSLGINDDISWDLEAAARAIAIQQFDHTVEDPAPDDPRMTFHKLMIAGEDGPDRVSLPTLIRRHDRGGDRPNLFLKMDIEGHEWEALDAIDDALLGRFSQIVCELHHFEHLRDTHWRRNTHRVLSRLHRHYAVVHVHGNNFGGLANVANVVFPNVLELSFANRAVFDLEETDELFPGPLDTSCDPGQADMYLGDFRF